MKDGRSAWVRRFRQDEYQAWTYLLDHGQEVGHVSDRAGQSPATASGYRIPAVVWRNRQPAAAAAGAGAQPFRADWMGWTLMDLLNIQSNGQQPERDVLATSYRWQAPGIPLKVKSFSR